MQTGQGLVPKTYFFQHRLLCGQNVLLTPSIREELHHLVCEVPGLESVKHGLPLVK